MAGKKFILLLAGLATIIVLFTGTVAFVVAPGSVPNPGHALSQIQGFFEGDISLLESMPKIQQRVSDVCPQYQGIKSVGEEGTVVCETGLQQRVTGVCPNSIRGINSNGSVDCESDSRMAVVDSSCPPGQIAKGIAADGTLTCADPVPRLCEYEDTGRMYSPGAKCNPTSSCSLFNPTQACICTASGSFNCGIWESYPCPVGC